MSKKEMPKPCGPAFMVKLPNRRVTGIRWSDGTIEYRFKNLVGGVIFKQRIRLSPEAVAAMIDIGAEIHAAQDNNGAIRRKRD